MTLLLALTLIAAAQTPPAQDPILRSMKDELDRSRTLNVARMAPYFIEYSLDDAVLYNVSATYGGVLNESNLRVRQPRVRIRVGDAKLDNTNHIFSEGYRGARYDSSQFALDDNYDALRLGWWLATDRTYKQALEALARKKASLRNVNLSEQLPDFSAASPLTHLPAFTQKPIEEALWRARVKALSSVFSAYPDILASEVTASTSLTTTYLLNSEGTQLRYPDNLASVRIRASAITPDGMAVRDHDYFVSPEASGLPAEAIMNAAAVRVAQNVTALTKAPSLDSYSGPMLFEGAAGPQLIAELLCRNLTVNRRPISDPDRPINLPAGELEGRIGSRILPEWADAVDDPTQKEWRGAPLMGFYVADADGVPPKPLPLVEKGVLKTYYTTRQPLPGAEISNGHARLPGGLGNNTATGGNLFFRSSQPVSAVDLKKRFLEMIQQRGKPFGIIVRKIDFPSTASGDEIRRIAGGSQGRAIARPLLAYKVTPDGKEELIRGVRFRGVNARSLKDMAAASDEAIVFQYLENRAPFAHLEAGGYVAGVSVIAPSLLFDDLELEKIPGELPKPPLVPPPSLTQ
ncbi:MAG: hypothetical protein HYZ37_00685 [Candidatus Solibacter usitatus]|nr:hypothetical protein [Candidatus Solibacter usitatus]